MPNSQNNEKTDRNRQNQPNNEKIKQFLHKISPYRELNVNPEDGFIRDTQSFVYYQSFAQWFVDVLLNGIFLNFILFCFQKQPLNPFLMLGDGILVWFVFMAIKRVWTVLIEGVIKIKRA